MNTEKLDILVNRIFEDSAGAAFWDADHDRLINEEHGEYELSFEGEKIILDTSEQFAYVLLELYEACDYCAVCGWVWWKDDMDVFEDELMCNSCIEDAQPEDEENEI